MKKLLAGAVSTAMFLGTVAPALAFGFWMPPATSNVATVTGNNVVAVANSGLNDQTAGGSVFQKMTTGYAGAQAEQVIIANVNVCGGCQTGVNNTATVRGNNVLAVANSGLNDQTVSAPRVSHHHHSSGGLTVQSMTTGDTGALASQWIVVNTSLGGFPL